MTTLEFFNRPRRIECGIRREQEKIQHYRDIAERCTSRIDGAVSGGGFGHSAMSHAAESIADSETRIEKLNGAYEQATMRIMDVIYSMDSELDSKVLAQRFLDNADAANIAMEMNYTASYIRRIIKGGVRRAEPWILENRPEYLEEEINDK